MTVLCFGELLLRLTPPGYRRVSQSDHLEIAVGGAEANVCAGLASLGHQTRFLSAVSDNVLGDVAINALRAAEVDTRYVARRPGRMGLYFHEEGSGSRPSNIVYDRADSAFAQTPACSIEFDLAMHGASLLHSGGITPALGACGIDLARAAHAAAKRAEVPICFDGNYRQSLWSAWDSRPRDILTELVSDATILIGNHRDISLLLDRSFSGDGEHRRREAADAAFTNFPKLEIIASTAREVISASHHRIAARVDSRENACQTEVIDVTGIVQRIGTGDAFAAGVLHAWLTGLSIESMARIGLAMSSLKHATHGDLCLVDAAAVHSFTALGGDIRR